MNRLLFGPAGVLASARTSSTLAGIERAAELGMGCLEMEFVRGIKMGREAALKIAEVASSRKIALSAHAPYFINFNARQQAKLMASQERLLQTARIASLCGAASIVFHPAFYLGHSSDEVFHQVKAQLQQVMSKLKTEGIQVWLRPEVTGKATQFGTLDEVIRLSAEMEGVAPCIDFAHWHARTSKFNSYDEFTFIFKQVENKLGRRALDNMHIHVSGVEYGKHGELRHLSLEESDFNYTDFAQSLRDCRVKGLVICESPHECREKDIVLLQQTYQDTGPRKPARI